MKMKGKIFLIPLIAIILMTSSVKGQETEYLIARGEIDDCLQFSLIVPPLDYPKGEIVPLSALFDIGLQEIEYLWISLNNEQREYYNLINTRIGVTIQVVMGEPIEVTLSYHYETKEKEGSGTIVIPFELLQKIVEIRELKHEIDACPYRADELKRAYESIEELEKINEELRSTIIVWKDAVAKSIEPQIYESLRTEHENLKKEHEELQAKYNELKEQSLLYVLSREWFSYILLLSTVILAITTIYFATRKRQSPIK